jgi:hypothetical protein
MPNKVSAITCARRKAGSPCAAMCWCCVFFRSDRRSSLKNTINTRRAAYGYKPYTDPEGGELSYIFGMISSGLMPRFSAYLASDSAAATAMLSVILWARTIRAPFRIPGKPRELFTWLGKSPRPVAVIKAPASLAA